MLRALKYGLAGEALLKKEEARFVKPSFDATIDEGERSLRLYTKDSLGTSMYMNDLKRIQDAEEEYHKKKRKFLADFDGSVGWNGPEGNSQHGS